MEPKDVIEILEEIYQEVYKASDEDGNIHSDEVYDIINIRVEDKTVRIPFNEIQKARLINYNGEHPCLSQT